jgi:hypothetical protein
MLQYWIIGGLSLWIAVIGYGGLRYLQTLKPKK